MAATNKPKKSPAKGTGGSAKKPSPAKGRGTVTATSASKAPNKPKGKSASGSAAQKSVNSKEKEKKAAKLKRRRDFSEQFLPYIFGGLALIFAVFLVLNLLEGADAPSTHPAGFVGYYFCQVFYGCFGWAACLIPLIFVNLAVFWRRYCKENLVTLKVILASLLMILISAFIHVAVCARDSAMAQNISIPELYRTGTEFKSGGVVGGLAGWGLYAGLKLPGSIALAVVSLPLLIMLFVGVTPDYVFGKIKKSVKEHKKKAAERVSQDGEEDYDEDETREEEGFYELDDDCAVAPVGGRRSKREKADAKRRRGEQLDSDTADGEEDDSSDDSSDPDPPASSARRSARRTALVDTDTGEVIESNYEDRRKGASRKTSASDEEISKLPFFESSAPDEGRNGTTDRAKRYDGAEVDWDPPAADDDFVAMKMSGRAARTAAAASNGLVDDREAGDYDSSLDTMVTDLDEEADSLFIDGEEEMTLAASEDAPSGGNYSVVYSAEPRAREGVTVTINRQEFDAVAESGLSEEELVLSTAHTAVERPAEPVWEYQFPSVEMLTRGSSRYEANDDEIAENTRLLREVLESFHIRVKEISCSCGPTITRFEVKPDTGVRVRSIANLVDDIAMNLAKAGVRIEAPIPGKAAVGIEVPNAEPATVFFRNILETPEFRNHKSRIAACLGADVSGRPVILDINKMPHLLIAGATGMGKSVCINSIVMSILYKAKPDEVKLILIDPKKVEFAMYRELPHLLCPIVSDPKQAAGTLYCAVNEMERRFGLIEEVGVRNLAGYNEVTADDPERPALPQIVIIIDELADLMMTAPADVETAICRLAQKARAAGIHLVIGTQRPSVDVITGLIKANIPSRIAFTVASAVDSRTIIDTVGADKLIGRGDMLYAPVGINKPMRCQGTFVSESEVERVVTFIKENNKPVVYDEEFIKNIAVEAARCGVNKKKGEQVSIDDFDGLGGGQNLWGEEPKFWEALEVVVSKEKFGTSALQRALHLGYGKAASIIDRMEEYGFVGPDPGNKTGRDVRITRAQLLDYKANGLPGQRRGDDNLFED
ncbi:MAG: DNA translocase FtsK 4TM domain-containing protein [Clostridia bacterium]|nr:DNA translocase FtsK 4TM domain-containing protein [Clostridia bacterium]